MTPFPEIRGKPYDILEHRHRFAVWAAARASQRGFTSVAVLSSTIDRAKIRDFVESKARTPIDRVKFDSLHRKWCGDAMAALSEYAPGIKDVTYGRAAKLVAIYLKSSVILGNALDTEFARVAHPPIDSILLRNLSKSSLGQNQRTSWSQLR